MPAETHSHRGPIDQVEIERIVREQLSEILEVDPDAITADARLRDDLGPEWPQPAGHGCYRVEITGEPNYTLDLQLMGTDGDHNTAGLKATAMRLVNAVPAVVAAPPGLVTALDLPVITGRGLVVT